PRHSQFRAVRRGQRGRLGRGDGRPATGPGSSTWGSDSKGVPMFPFLRKLLGGRPAASGVGQRRSLSRRRLGCAALEDRTVPSVFGPEIHVNTRTINNQSQAATASSLNGRSVVVWTDCFSSTDRDIRAQIFDSAGRRVGREIIVAFSTRNEYDPAVA